MAQQSLAESARLVRGITIAALILLVAAFAVSRFGFDLGPSVAVIRRSHSAGFSLAGAIGDLGVLFFAIALVQLIRLLGRLGSGDMFAPAVTRAFRSFAFWLMLSAVTALAGPPLAGLIAALGGGTHRIEFRIDLRDVMFVIAGLVLFLVSRMLDEAARLDAELKEIV